MVSTSEFSLIAAGIFGLLAVFAFLSAVLTAQRGRTAAYYSVRRETQQRANHKLMLSLALLLFAGILFAGSLMLPRDGLPAMTTVATAPAPSPTITVAATNIVPASPTSASPIATPTLVSTALPRPTLAPQSTAALISPLPTPIVEPTSAPTVADPNKRLVLNAIASGRDENGQPVGSGTSFQAGTPTLYIFFDYRDVPPNALLRHTWFRDGGSVYFASQRFNQNGAGMAAVQWTPRGGFEAGLYEVRVQLGGAPQFVANFEVK